MAPLNILITGAGVGGSALAFWLAKLNHNVTIIERHPCLRVNGLQLDLRGYGIEVMKRMGIEQVIRSKLAPEEGIELVDEKGRRQAYFPANKSGKGAQSITSEYEIMRRDLCQILHDIAVEKGAKYVFGTYVESFEERNGRVNVTFADGKADTFDMVVGADGLGSRLRRMMFAGSTGDGKDTLVELKERVAYFTIPKPIKENETYDGKGMILTGKRCIFTRRHSPDEIQVYLMCDVDAGPEEGVKAIRAMRKGDIKTEKDAFIKMYRGSGWITNEITKAIQDGAEDWYCQYTGFVKMDQWSKGHVTLVGDAAHGAPADGMGTSAAMIGAYILAGEIQKHCGSSGKAESTDNPEVDGIQSAIESYERIFQPYIKQTHKGLSAEPSLMERIPWTPLTVQLMLWLAWLVSLIRLDLILAGLFPAENIKGWKLPEYDMIKS